MPKVLKLEYSLNKNVYDTFLDLRKFGELHPNIVKVNIIGNPEINCVEYEIFEEITLLGFIPMKPYYKAKVVEIEKGKHIQYLSQVKGNVFLAINFTFWPNDKGMHVKEDIEITGNAVVASILMGAIKKAHTQIFESLRK